MPAANLWRWRLKDSPNPRCRRCGDEVYRNYGRGNGLCRLCAAFVMRKTPYEAEDVFELWEAGWKLADVAARFAITPQRAHQVVKDFLRRHPGAREQMGVRLPRNGHVFRDGREVREGGGE